MPAAALRPIIWLFSAAVALALLVIWLVPQLPKFLVGREQPVRADAIVSLAGGERSKWRLREALRLVREGYATNLVVSGVEFDPQHRYFDQPTWDLLRENLGAARVIVDPQSDATQESARFVRRLAENEDWRAVLVVTSEFHWRRTRALFHYECEPGLDVRVCTINDQKFDRWWLNSYRARLVFNEFWRIAVFALFQSVYGLWILAIAAVIGAGLVLVKRLIP